MYVGDSDDYLIGNFLVSGLTLLVCMRPYAASVCGLKLLVYAALCGGVCECGGDRDDCLIGNLCILP